eukprot:COSAG02_NODE_19652_length_871_cov_1.097150_1_plen_156_part_10
MVQGRKINFGNLNAAQSSAWGYNLADNGEMYGYKSGEWYGWGRDFDGTDIMVRSNEPNNVLGSGIILDRVWRFYGLEEWKFKVPGAGFYQVHVGYYDTDYGVLTTGCRLGGQGWEGAPPTVGQPNLGARLHNSKVASLAHYLGLTEVNGGFNGGSG